jgi:hypothetical protein
MSYYFCSSIVKIDKKDIYLSGIDIYLSSGYQFDLLITW